MPWQETALWLASVAADGGLGPPRQVAGGAAESILQPEFSPDGVLHFLSDRSGWWNLYRLDHGVAEPLCPLDAELGTALWSFGQSTYAFVDRSTIVCAFQRDGLWHLGVIDTEAGRLAEVPAPLTEVSSVHAQAGRAVFVGASPTEAPAIWELSLASGSVRALHRPNLPVVDPAYLSRPESISFPTAAGATAHAFHYAPVNPDVTPPAGERPPLIVVSHGGPTAAASSALSLALQFWTSRGFAVLDVNYRGSTGYGRAYRNALDGAWGIADVEDCIAGARHLVERGAADGARLIIRGGSAGGYTTLAALAFTDVFRAGASYYGISDLEGLARDSHKFESRYLDTLVGPYPACGELYRARSPIHHVDRLSCPVIFFQGLEDKVVPPDQAERMVAALAARGLPAPYLAFPGEQHGFRRADTIVRALEAELGFYRHVFGLPESG
jgi:dipeptidyl aminopeptidase/acylaminoacyl peptidase